MSASEQGLGGGAAGTTLPCVVAVDDEPDNLSGIRRTLRGRCEVVCCGSGAEALAVVKQRQVDLVISDLRMPGMTGIELLEQVRLVSPSTQRLILSAYSQGADLLDAINRGSVLRYLLKPISPEKLRQVIGDALAGVHPPSTERVTLLAAGEERALLAAALGRLGVHAGSSDEALAVSDEAAKGLVVLDLALPSPPSLAGDELLARVQRQGGELAVISGEAGPAFDEALRLVRRGASALLRRPLLVDEIDRFFERTLSRRALAAELSRLRHTERGPFHELAGGSAAMRRLISALSSVAQIDSTVMLRGETGTGKEVAARAVHAASARAAGPFVACHCAAMAGTLLESELFGHEKGAFTGATDRRQGRFERAHGGTLFLDEVGEIPPETQVKLLRVLQERVVERVGGREPIPVDVRVVGATHRDLEAMIERGQFREDLYYRLNVIPIFLPPLRDRREDIPELALRFLDQHQRAMGKQGITFPAAMLDALAQRPWPGNVRQLRNEIERLLAFTPANTPIDPSLLPSLPGAAGGALAAAAPGATLLPLDETGTIHEIMDRLEAQVTRRFLEQHGWNQTSAAQRLGVTRQALAKRIQKFSLERGDKETP